MAAILVLSGSLVPCVIALWLLAWVFASGDLVMRRLGINATDDICDRAVVAVPIGLTALALITLLMGVLGLLNAGVAWTILLSTSLPGGLVGLPRWRGYVLEARRSWSVITQSSPLAPFLLIALGLMFILNLTWSVAPEIQYDGLNVRLGVPKFYVAEGRFVDLSYMFHSYFVRIMEWVYGFCMALHNESVAKLLNAGISIMAAIGVYSLGRALFSANVGLWAAVLFYTTPLASWVAASSYTDLVVALFATALVLSCIYYQRTRSSAWLAVAGVLAAAAMSVKLTAAPVVMACLVVLVWLVFRSAGSWGAAIRSVDLPIALAVLVAWPWHLLTYILTGNPIFPMLNDVFRSPKWELVNTDFNQEFGLGTSIGALLRLPFRVTLDTTRFGEALTRGALGPLLLFFIPLGLLLILRKNTSVRIFVAITSIAFLVWALALQYARFYLAILPGIAVLAVAGLHEVLPERLSRYAAPGFLVVLLAAQGMVTPLLYWNIPERYPIEFAFGREESRPFLRRALHGYGSTEHLNARVPPNGRVLTIGLENVRFYLSAPLESLAEALIDSPLRRVTDLNGRELAEALSEMGFTHLLLLRSEMENPSFYTFAKPDFLREYAVLEYSEEAAVVFRLKR